MIPKWSCDTEKIRQLFIPAVNNTMSSSNIDYNWLVVCESVWGVRLCVRVCVVRNTNDTNTISKACPSMIGNIMLFVFLLTNCDPSEKLNKKAS